MRRRVNPKSTRGWCRRVCAGIDKVRAIVGHLRHLAVGLVELWSLIYLLYSIALKR
jgi:hypothetical protein